MPFDSGGSTSIPKIAHGVFLAGWLDGKDGVTAQTINSTSGYVEVEEGTAPNNHAAIHFFGGGFVFITTPATTTTYDFWFIVQVLSSQNGVSAYDAAPLISGFDHNGDFGVVVRDDATVVQFNDDGAIDSVSLPAATFRKWVKIRARRDATKLYLSINDSVESTVVTGANVTADPTATMGVEYGTGRIADMRVAEVVFASKTITADEQVNLQRYFKLRYGL